MSVLRTVISAFHASKTYAFSTEQYDVFIQYALVEMEHHPDDVITLLMKFLENNANIRRDVTQGLITQVSCALASSGNIQRKRFAQQIADAFVGRFPDARLKNDAIAIDSYRSVSIQDRTVHNAIVELFSAAATPTCLMDHKISTLAQMARSQPCVVLRHLPLLSACLASVAQLPVRQLRTNSYQSLLQYIPKLLLDLAPQSFEEADRLQAILQTFFTLFENVGCGRTWIPLAQILQNVCVAYLELNAKSAKTYFLTQIEAIKQLCLCLKSPSSKILIDMIMCLNRVEE
ncbi:unnamed protein product [Onchocerca flexuosa]|nr:unnamed protein product [Onchocerca flexuosa]